jgi:hypothetical protein
MIRDFSIEYSRDVFADGAIAAMCLDNDSLEEIVREIDRPGSRFPRLACALPRGVRFIGRRGGLFDGFRFFRLRRVRRLTFQNAGHSPPYPVFRGHAE